MPRYAAIDLGSNSVLLLAVTVDNKGTVNVLIDTRGSVCLSTHFRCGDILDEAAISRLLITLDEFQVTLARYDVDNVVVCATQVFRAAANGPDVADTISRRYGWKVRIIDGKTEAALSYLAAATGLRHTPEGRVVIDVGGGSTEIVRGLAREIDYADSFPIGAVSLAERYHLSDRVDAATLNQAATDISEVFAASGLVSFPQKEFTIVVGGTATALATIKNGEKVFNPDAVHGVELSGKWLQRELFRLSDLSLEERMELMSFDPTRASIIVGGCLIVAGLMYQLHLEEITVSNRGLRWGLLLSEFGLTNTD